MRFPVSVSTVMVLMFVGGGRGTVGADTGAVVVDDSVRQYGALLGARRIDLHALYSLLERIGLETMLLMKVDADDAVTDSTGTNVGEVFMVNGKR